MRRLSALRSTSREPGVGSGSESKPARASRPQVRIPEAAMSLPETQRTTRGSFAPKRTFRQVAFVTHLFSLCSARPDLALVPHTVARLPI